MGQYWTKKGDQDDQDEKTAYPFADMVGHANIEYPDPNDTDKP